MENINYMNLFYKTIFYNYKNIFDAYHFTTIRFHSNLGNLRFSFDILRFNLTESHIFLWML